MSQNRQLDLGPSLLVGIGIIVSTLVAILTADYGWWVLAGPLLLALTFVSVDVMESRLKGEAFGPSPAALILGAVFVLAGVIVMLRDPSLVKPLIAVIGPATWVSILLRPEGQRSTCRWI